ncbi:MAG: AAA domain-containing protein [Bacteroidota bacterium]
MKKQELARLFFREISKIYNNESFDDFTKIRGLHHLLNQLFLEVTRDEKLQFTTMFARISFACQKFSVEKQTQFYVHAFRKVAREMLQREEAPTSNLDDELQLGLKVVADVIVAFFHQIPPQDVAEIIPLKIDYKTSPVEVKAFKPLARIVATDLDTTNEQLIGRDEEIPTKEIRVQYNIAERNQNFMPTIAIVREIFDFPLTINLLDVEIDNEGIYRPRAFVVEPDYLVDVSAVSECFKDFGTFPLFNLLKKFLPFTYTKYLMIGNIANFFLDELMTNPEATFKETFPKVFQLNPLAFATFENAEIREIMQTSQRHFLNLKQMVHSEFEKSDIVPKDCFLEPTFYSQKHGIQGRLDVFYRKNNGDKDSAIVELKSGKTYKPNKYGINQNHFVQTLLYDLMVKAVFGKKIQPANFILYSGAENQQLRFAPTVNSQQMEALQIRNQLVAIEYQLAKINGKDLANPLIFSKLNASRLPHLSGFLKKDLALFEKVYQGMSVVERKYFNAFAGFIAREHLLAKTGVQGIEHINGLASLWLKDFKEKEQSFEIISFLKIKTNNSAEDKPLVVFEKTPKTNPLANFRQGDIAVLYPFENEKSTVLTNQIFKCTIIEISAAEVHVQLRSRQFNTSIFEKDFHWNIEHDMLDSSFNSMYRSLFQFAQFPPFKKELLLTLSPPQPPEAIEISPPRELTEEQKSIFQKAIAAKDYFLLWGPPGTGKTSMMLKNIVSYLLNETDENLLLLAYTNRAVDEICEAVESIDKLAREEYLRLGSGHSCGEKYRDRLFNSKIANINNRKELRHIIEQHRIFVSTVAGIAGKQEILQLKTFHRVIIDEASQIPEPMLVGLLPHFKRFTLIGDHKQLPAVVVQSKSVSKVEDEDLRKLGLVNLRNSLFERMYKRCLEEKWDWAFARLSHQGRMHQEIMNFPSENFYNGFLKILPKELNNEFQTQSIDYQSLTTATTLEKILTNQRFIFLATPTDFQSTTGKTNAHEAALVSEVIEAFEKIYQNNELDFTDKTLGVITPYRAQIAQIRHALHEKNIATEKLTIDTVERYQGGARDIILISLCTNSLRQLESLVSVSEDGVDRKLNVALTRARKHVVIIGSPQILRHNDIYDKLIIQYQKIINN